MKIKAASPYERECDETVAQYAERCLGRSDDDGRLEAIATGRRNNSRAIGRLLEVLAGKGLLTAPEVTGIVDRRENADAKFLV